MYSHAGAMGTRVTLLNKEEEKFIVKLQQLIATRIEQMMHSADELLTLLSYCDNISI